MEKIVRAFTLLQYIRDTNRKGIYPDRKMILKEMTYRLRSMENDDTLIYSEQHFDRDKHSLREMRVKLLCDKEKCYSFESEQESGLVDNLLNTYMLLTTQNKKSLFPEYVIQEPRRHTGSQYLPICMHAIEEHYQLQLIYYDYRDEQTKTYTVQPYKLKHKDYKWYLLAVDVAKPEVPFKSFALERIRSIEEGESFSPNKQLDFVTPYRDAFGMFTDEQAERLVLEFDHRDGNYLMASPIHPSQRVVSETKTRITFELYIKPTLDLIMELMKRSWSLTIIEPQHLREKFLNYWGEAIKRNKKVKSIKTQ